MKIYWLLLHIVLAFLPVIFSRIFGGELRAEWWVLPMLIMNGFIQGIGFAWKFKK